MGRQRATETAVSLTSLSHRQSLEASCHGLGMGLSLRASDPLCAVTAVRLYPVTT